MADKSVFKMCSFCLTEVIVFPRIALEYGETLPYKGQGLTTAKKKTQLIQTKGNNRDTEGSLICMCHVCQVTSIHIMIINRLGAWPNQPDRRLSRICK